MLLLGAVLFCLGKKCGRYPENTKSLLVRQTYFLQLRTWDITSQGYSLNYLCDAWLIKLTAASVNQVVKEPLQSGLTILIY